jgi:hypothetical protein
MGATRRRSLRTGSRHVPLHRQSRISGQILSSRRCCSSHGGRCGNGYRDQRWCHQSRRQGHGNTSSRASSLAIAPTPLYPPCPRRHPPLPPVRQCAPCSLEAGDIPYGSAKSSCAWWRLRAASPGHHHRSIAGRHRRVRQLVPLEGSFPSIESSSHPPANPARLSPVTRYGH